MLVADWRGPENIDEVVAARTGQVLVADAPAPGGGLAVSAMGPRAIRRRILEFALSLPGAFEDHPWDDTVVKVNKKVFVFLGHEDHPDSGMSVKLRTAGKRQVGDGRARTGGNDEHKEGHAEVH